MKNIKIDIYKSIFLLILWVFVYCFYLNTQNGRFQLGSNVDLSHFEIIDTHSGAVYQKSAADFNLSADTLILINHPIIQ